MRSLTNFHLFTELPRELQDMIWKCHRQRRGIRHYMVLLQDTGRHYAAIDIDTNLVARTILTKREIKTYWDSGNPIKGETDSKIRLLGKLRVAEHGDVAKSVATANYPETWDRKTRPAIRIDFNSDVVLLEGSPSCLRAANVADENHASSFISYHWLKNVRRLALRVSGCSRSVLSIVSMLPSLREVYLVVCRDPLCPYGPPRQWSDFERSLLDSQGFLPLYDFIRLHPQESGLACTCETNSVRAAAVQIELQTEMGRRNSVLPVSVVADPY